MYVQNQFSDKGIIFLYYSKIKYIIGFEVTVCVRVFFQSSLMFYMVILTLFELYNHS